MKILTTNVLAPYKTDAWVYIEGLVNLGHEIVVANIHRNYDKIDIQINENKLQNIDIIWAQYEFEVVCANIIKNKYKIDAPIIGHFEWAAPFRTGMENPKDWGYFEEKDIYELSKQHEYWNREYGYYMNDFEKCKMWSVPTKYCFDTIKFIKPGLSESNVFIKPYIIDDVFLRSFKDTTIIPKRQIVTISRLTQHKRIHHIVEALGLLNNPPPLKIIGTGEMSKHLIKRAKELNVNIEFCGYGNNGEKAKVIQESLFAVHPFASLPVGECALFERPSIMYDNKNMTEKHGDFGTFVPNNDIVKLSERIQYYLDNLDLVKEQGKKDYNTLMSGKSGLVTQKDACKFMEGVFYECIGI